MSFEYLLPLQPWFKMPKIQKGNDSHLQNFPKILILFTFVDRKDTERFMNNAF